jgi:DNA-binding NtrC family response regulator
VHNATPHKLAVLVVEDERRLRTLLEEMVPELGFGVSAAASGEAALSIMESDPHDIVLLDLQLPGMSGIDLLERIRASWPRTQAVILTAFGNLETARRAIHLDVVEFLCKPFHLRDIELAFDRARQRLAEAQQRAEASPARTDPTGPAITLAEAEYRQILAALQRNAGSRTAAAADLGISRRTLHYRLAEYRERGRRVEE